MRSTVAIVLALWGQVSAAPGAVCEQRFDTAPSGSEPQPNANCLLDVPYVPQSPALCGGAAAAMVLRYWGELGVQPKEFTSLMDQDQRGIATGVLTEAVRSLGWHAVEFRGREGVVRDHLLKGRPLVVLLEERADVFHYVVLIGWVSDRAVLHDPARGPYRLLHRDQLEAAWAASGYWALLILPAEDEDRPIEKRQQEMIPSSSHSCSAMVSDGVRLARTGDLAGAEAVLAASGAICPDLAAPLRELAGIRFVERRWDEATHFAKLAVSLDPADTHAWRTLAASRFLQDDFDAALEAWNHIDEPQLDLIRIDGLSRIRYKEVGENVGLEPGTLLTPQKLRHARRRLSSLPALQSSRIRYRPLAEGLAQVDVAVVERPLFLNGPADWVGSALYALSEREISIKLSSPTGGGELWAASWRWWEERPRVSLSLAVPDVGGFAGVWKVEGFWERQSYGAETLPEATGTAPNAVVREGRQRAALAISDWSSADSRWELRAGLDRWEAQGRYFSLGGAFEKRFAGDRIALQMEGEGWSGLDRQRRFAAGTLGTAWRSSVGEQRAVLLGRAALVSTTSTAPLALWPGAGVGHARAPLLRAHPLLHDGVIQGKIFGRGLVHGGLEFQNRLSRRGPVRLALALFLDTAKSWRRFSSSSSALHADLGAGLRLTVLGQERTLRVDAAYGLRDGEYALSVGWELPWPGRH